jgi:ABC-2 type transport system ATP-binding protein
MEGFMLRVQNLTRQYGTFRAVDDVSFELPKGEVIGLLGHNGAGKTTMMKIISGFMEADEGTVEIDGVPLAGHEKQIQQSLGYLPENLPVYPEMTVSDYLDYCADLKGISGAEKTFEIRRVVKATSLESKFLSPIEALSRGYKQRVGVAQAVLGKPKLLILDEPTNGLDPEQTAHMRQLIRDIAKDATVILSTHIMQEVEALCSHVLILRSGRLVIDSTLAELKESHEIDISCSIELNQSFVFKEVTGVKSVKTLVTEGDWTTYRISVQSDADMAQVASRLAGKCMSCNANLYRLAANETDLEKLFFDVTQNEEVSDAA